MKNVIFIFGSSSLIARKFIEKFSKVYECVGIGRENRKFNKNIIRNVIFDLSQIYSRDEIKNFSDKLFLDYQNSNKIFILFSWAGKPRDVIKNLSLRNWEANQNIVKNFKEFSSIINPSHIVFISSAGAIYNQNSHRRSKETDKPFLNNSYGKQKLQVEESLDKFCKTKSINLSILRVSTVYGYNSEFADHGVINKWLFNAKNNSFLELYNDPKSLVNFISVENVSEAINICIQEKIFGLFNIGSIDSISLEDLIEVVKKVSKCNNLNLKILANEYRSFKLDTSLFQAKSKLIFKNNFNNELENIFLMIKGN